VTDNQGTMPIEVRISEPLLLDELVAAFLRNGCVAQRRSDDSCLVVHVQAAHDEEARQELSFFVRAWQMQHPAVAAVVAP
jgi:hypothetical protein